MRHEREVLVHVLIYHQRKNAESCLCGWGVGSGAIGLSHADHVADVYEDELFRWWGPS